MRYQPVDYSIDIQPQQSGLFEDIQAIRQVGQARQARELALKRKAEFEPLFEDLYNNYSTEKAARLNAQFPEYGAQFKTLLPLEGVQKKQALAQVAGINNAFKAGKTDVGLERLFSLAKGHRDRGEDVMADFYEGIRQDFIDSPDQAEMLLDQFNLFNNPEMVKQEADLLKTRKETEKLGEEAKEITQKTLRDEVMLGSDYARSLLDNKKLDVDIKKGLFDIKKTKKELESFGKGKITDPKEKMDAETKLRDNYFKHNQNFFETQDAYNRIKATKADATGDLSLVIGYMKMLDPGSVVREGEQLMVKKTTGVPNMVWNYFNQLKTGETLDPDQRKKVRAQAEELYKAALKKHDAIKKPIKSQVDMYGLSDENIFSSIEGMEWDLPVSGFSEGEGAGVLKVGQTGVVKDPSGENVVVKKIRD